MSSAGRRALTPLGVTGAVSSPRARPAEPSANSPQQTKIRILGNASSILGFIMSNGYEEGRNAQV